MSLPMFRHHEEPALTLTDTLTATPDGELRMFLRRRERSRTQT